MNSSQWRDPPKAPLLPLPGTNIQISTPNPYVLNICCVPLCVSVGVNVYPGYVWISRVFFWFHVRNLTMLYIFAVNYYTYSDENHNSHGHGILAYKCGERKIMPHMVSFICCSLQ